MKSDEIGMSSDPVVEAAVARINETFFQLAQGALLVDGSIMALGRSNPGPASSSSSQPMCGVEEVADCLLQSVRKLEMVNVDVRPPAKKGKGRVKPSGKANTAGSGDHRTVHDICECFDQLYAAIDGFDDNGRGNSWGRLSSNTYAAIMHSGLRHFLEKQFGLSMIEFACRYDISVACARLLARLAQHALFAPLVFDKWGESTSSLFDKWEQITRQASVLTRALSNDSDTLMEGDGSVQLSSLSLEIDLEAQIISACKSVYCRERQPSLSVADDDVIEICVEPRQPTVLDADGRGPIGQRKRGRDAPEGSAPQVKIAKDERREGASVQVELLRSEYVSALQPEVFRTIPEMPGYKLTADKSTKNQTARMRELASLANLPCEWCSSIFVRACEGNTNMLQALLIGPPDTPYANGCFLFDIALLGDYPDVPPSVLLRTTNGRTRFNPNLYEEGKVCLSLLGTWSGPGWIKGTSTLRQVLMSIQCIIMVPDPYFNEPGWESARGTAKGEKASHNYNLPIYHYTAQLAIRDAIRNPPVGFENVVKTHFMLKKGEIVAQFNLWRSNLRKSLNTTASYKSVGINSWDSLERECLEEIEKLSTSYQS